MLYPENEMWGFLWFDENQMHHRDRGRRATLNTPVFLQKVRVKLLPEKILISVKNRRVYFVSRNKVGISDENLEMSVKILNFRGLNILKCRKERRNSLPKAILIAYENVLHSDTLSGQFSCSLSAAQSDY